jgi:aconitate hydratase
VAESFERIHRSNLIGMGVLPLQFQDGQSWSALGLTGAETVSIAGVAGLKPREKVTLHITRPGGKVDEVSVLCRIDTENEVEYLQNGGILHYVLRGLAKSA